MHSDMIYKMTELKLFLDGSVEGPGAGIWGLRPRLRSLATARNAPLHLISTLNPIVAESP